MKNILLILLLVGIQVSVFSQNIIGPQTVNVGDEETYTYTQNNTGDGLHWVVLSGGEILTENGFDVVVLWKVSGTHTLQFKYQEEVLENYSVVVSESFGYTYTYDNAGNRTSRTWGSITLKGASEITEHRPEQQSKEDKGFSTLDGNIILYPNPTPDRIYIATELINENASIAIEVFTMTGAKVFVDTFIPPKHELDMTNYKAGTYILILTCGSDKKHFKVVKE